MPVTLINSFEVPPQADETFLRVWQGVADFMKRQPGFINTRLHRALRPDAHFRFVNVAQWRTPQDFMTATQTEEFKTLTEGSPPSFASLYETLIDDHVDGAK